MILTSHLGIFRTISNIYYGTVFAEISSEKFERVLNTPLAQLFSRTARYSDKMRDLPYFRKA